MPKTNIAAALATSLAIAVVLLGPAQAAPRHVQGAATGAAITPSKFHNVYNQVPTFRPPAVSEHNSDWESRSQFYRGPTYIGRY